MTPLRKLSRSFYIRPTLVIARELPGKFFLRRLNGRLLIGRIVEVEAYLGRRDPASHAFRGKTPRNEVMFGEGGHLYVYFTYGMHFCCNVVTEEAGKGCAVLIRGLEPLEGIDVMTSLRSRWQKHSLRRVDLCSGPGKVCEAFGLGREENGIDLCGDTVWIAREGGRGRSFRIARSARIGITNGGEHTWRFYAEGSPFVSRRSPPSPPHKKRGR